MPDPTLFDVAVDNRGLFADHYLTERFPERDDVQALQPEADAAFDRLREHYRRAAAEADTWNEAQTEDNFVQPVLKDVLGWARKVQPHVQRQGRAGRPDYALFVDEERRATAVDRADGDETKVFDHADAVADAKYWGRPLDGPAPDPAREKRAEMRRNNPSFQIIDYVTLTGVDWGLLTNGARWRLYYEGAPSRLETYFEVNLPEIMRLADGDADQQAEARRAFRLFYALFRAESFRPSPTTDGQKFVDAVYAASDTYAESLEDTLKERVFDHVFLALATGLYEDHVRRNGAGDPEDVLDDVYRATLRLLYRLLFLLYAESRGLLPLDNPGYYDHSLTRLAQRAKEAVAGNRPLSNKHTDFWNDLRALFRTIDEGDPAFDVPAYNGGLFRQGSPENAVLDNNAIGQTYVAHALVNLTAVDPETNPTGPSVDYTSLDVRQLGSIYEGLLEHRLVVTEDDELDLRTDEGERKETGSYYTPHYIVEYIVEETLGPIVDERIEQFEAAMDEITDIVDGRDPTDPGVKAKLDAPRQQALDAFLTVRVCDPAMGSGHFLVYAADYLAERFGQVLGRYPNHNPVTQRLDAIRQSILDELARQGVDTDELEGDNRLRDTSLLKRLVMKRCIYGVDKNPMAVELAKLSLWLHSFTVGAPLSFLDHHLKAGNSLVGTSVGTVVDEIQADLFGNVRDEILRGTKFLQDAAFNTDATLADVRQSARAFATYRDTMRPYKRLLDLWTAQHFGVKNTKDLVFQSARDVIMAYQDDAEAALKDEHEAVARTEQLRQQKRFFHWELEFPEVFYELDPPGDRDNPGFDAVIGNPPYNSKRSKETKQLAPLFEHGSYRFDPFGLFLEQGFDLCRNQGHLGLIIPATWTGNEYYTSIRKMLLETQSLDEVIIFENQVFEDANVDTSILISRKFGVEGERYRIDKVKSENLLEADPVEKPYDLIKISERFDVPPTTSKIWGEIIINLYQEAVKLGEISDRISLGLRVESVENDVSDTRDSKHPNPIFLGSEIQRYGPLTPQSYFDFEEGSIIGGTRDSEVYSHTPKILLQSIRNLALERRLVPVVDEEGYHFGGNVVGILVQEDVELDSHYLQAVIASDLINQFFQHRFTTISLTSTFLSEIPVREIEFTTDEDEREAHVNTLIDEVEAARAAGTNPADAAVLNAVDDHLAADPERSGVVHDLLAHLAREMTDLKAERATYHLDVTDYVPAPSADDGVTLREIGRYQPAPGAPDSLLAATTETHDGLRIGRLVAEPDGDTVRVRATARFKPAGERSEWPEAVPDGAEPDQWGYVETDPLPACTLHDGTEIEAGLVVHWLRALNDADAGFSNYRDTATKTISLLDRIYDARLPDPSDEDVANALRPFLDNARAAAALDRQIAFTDGLIDRIVYRLYGLTDEEVAVVEGA